MYTTYILITRLTAQVKKQLPSPFLFLRCAAAAEENELANGETTTRQLKMQINSEKRERERKTAESELARWQLNENSVY